MADAFETYSPGLNSPAASAGEVTPSDETPLAAVSRALWIGTGGDVAVTMAGGADVTFANVPDGSLLPIRVSHVLAATSADDIVAIW